MIWAKNSKAECLERLFCNHHLSQHSICDQIETDCAKKMEMESRKSQDGIPLSDHIDCAFGVAIKATAKSPYLHDMIKNSKAGCLKRSFCHHCLVLHWTCDLWTASLNFWNAHADYHTSDQVEESVATKTYFTNIRIRIGKDRYRPQ